MEQEDKEVYVEKKEEKSADTSKVGVAFIKYATYLIIFFGVMWFLIRYILPIFR